MHEFELLLLRFSRIPRVSDATLYTEQKSGNAGFSESQSFHSPHTSLRNFKVLLSDIITISFDPLHSSSLIALSNSDLKQFAHRNCCPLQSWEIL